MSDEEESFTSRFRLRRPRKTQATTSSRTSELSNTKERLAEEIFGFNAPLTPLLASDSASAGTSSSSQSEDDSQRLTTVASGDKHRRKSFPDNADFESAHVEHRLRGPSTRHRPQWKKKRIQPTTSDDEDAQLVGRTDLLDLDIFPENEQQRNESASNAGRDAAEPSLSNDRSAEAPAPEPNSPPWNLAHLRKKEHTPEQIVEHQPKGILDFIPLRRAAIPLHHSRIELIQRAQPNHTKRFLTHARETAFGSDQPSQKQRKQAAAGHKHLHSLKRIPYLHQEPKERRGSEASRSSEDEQLLQNRSKGLKKRQKDKAVPRAAASFVPLEMVAADDPDVNYRVERKKDTPAKHIKLGKKSKRKPRPLPKAMKPLTFGPQKAANAPENPAGQCHHLEQLDHGEEQMPSVHMPSPGPIASVRPQTPASIARAQPMVYSSVEKARAAADASLADHQPKFLEHPSVHQYSAPNHQSSGFAPELDLHPIPTIRQHSLSLGLPGLVFPAEQQASLQFEEHQMQLSDELGSKEQVEHETTEDDEPTPTGPSDPWHSLHSPRNGYVLAPNTPVDEIMQEPDIDERIRRSVTPNSDPIETDGYEGDLEADCTNDEYFARYNNADLPPAGQAVLTLPASDQEMTFEAPKPRPKKKKRILIAPDKEEDWSDQPILPAARHEARINRAARPRRNEPAMPADNLSPILEHQPLSQHSEQVIACSTSARTYLRQRQMEPRSSSQPVASHFSYRGGFRSDVLSGQQAADLFRPVRVIIDAGTAREARVRTITRMEQLQH